MKTVLHICLSESWGGLEMAVSKWNQILHENGHKNLTICTPQSPLAKDLTEKGFKTLQWDSANYFAPDFSLKLRKLLLTTHIDAVVLQNLRDLWIVSPALWGLKNINLLGFTQMLVGVKKKDLLHRLVYKPLTHALTLTDWQQQALAPYLPIAPHKYKTIPNFVDTNLFHPKWRSEDFRYQLGFQPEDFVIGVIGRIDRQKGQKELLEAFAKLKQKHSNVHLMIIGEPTLGEQQQEEYFRDLRDFVEKNNLDSRVHFKSFQKETHQLYANFDLFVLPSYQETFGFVVVEAMASGTPVLGTQAGGVPEILNQGRLGFLCKPKDSASIHKQLEHIINAPDERSDKAQLALERTRDFYDRTKVYQRFLQYL